MDTEEFTMTTVDRYLISLLRALIAVALAYGVFQVIYSSYAIVMYPFQMDLIEGPMMDGVVRIHEGLPIYVEPSLEYTPLMYTPLYYYVTAAVSYITGLTLVAGKFVSLLSTLVLCVVIYLWFRKESYSKSIAVMGVALFLAYFEIVNRWYALARLDMLFVALMMWGLFVYFYCKSHAFAAVSGLLLALAFFTKQQTLIIVLPVLAAGLIIKKPYRWTAATIFVALVVAGCAYYEHISDGWFSFMVFEIPATMTKKLYFTWRFIRVDILGYMTVCTFFTLFWFYEELQKDWRKYLLWAAMVAGAFVAAWWSRIHPGGAENVNIPFYTILTFTTVFGMQKLIEKQSLPLVFIYALFLMQLGKFIMYYPLYAVPDQNQLKAAQNIQNTIAGFEGDVFTPDMQFNQYRLGKKSFSYRWLGFDFVQSSSPKAKAILNKIQNEIKEAVERKQFSAIILSFKSNVPEKENYYIYKGKIMDPELEKKIPPNILSSSLLPNYLYVPKTE
jgi:hypothetical protein